MRHKLARGLTLVEVLVATVLTGVAVLGALGMLNQAEAVTGQLQRSAIAAQRSQAAIARLRSLVSQLSVSRDTSATLIGSGTSVQFASRCRVPRGWVEPCAIEVSVEDSSGLSHLHISENTSSHWDVLEGSMLLQLLYLEDAVGNGRWRGAWRETHAVPLALGVIRAKENVTDTVIFRIGWRE